jgi:hypothetical protein
MAAKVDAQNSNDPAYQPMAGHEKENPAFQAARALIFRGAGQPNGYTEPLQHAFRCEKRNCRAADLIGVPDRNIQHPIRTGDSPVRNYLSCRQIFSGDGFVRRCDTNKMTNELSCLQGRRVTTGNRHIQLLVNSNRGYVQN